MRVNKLNSELISIAQLAARWGVSRQRIRALISSGYLDGALQIPASGKFRAVTKVPMRAIAELEGKWRIMPRNAQAAQENSSPLRKASVSHFPELYDLLESDAEYLSGDRRSDEHTA